jgi:hypothetical protein
VIGIAWAWAVVFPVAFAITTHRTLRALNMRASELASAIGVTVAAAAVMGLSVHLAWLVLPETLGSWFRLGLLIVIGVVINGGLVYRFDRGLMTDLRVLRAG